jgi:hypothetical protein
MPNRRGNSGPLMSSRYESHSNLELLPLVSQFETGTWEAERYNLINI